jgi:hypothetical protein
MLFRNNQKDQKDQKDLNAHLKLPEVLDAVGDYDQLKAYYK